MQYRSFSSGDQIWVSQRYGQDVTVKFKTSDGLVWEEGDATFRKLHGVEKAIHQVEVFCLKLIKKVLA